MNREIKFISRYPAGHQTRRDGQISNHWGFNEYGYYHQNGLPNSEHIQCQYIGLKDKNGVEVYEGDIVADSEQRFVIGHGESIVGEMKFWGWTMKRTPYHPDWEVYPIDPEDMAVIEVVGNIYEHPHLLNA